jgi:DNA-nicking Smr family endonuclease
MYSGAGIMSSKKQSSVTCVTHSFKDLKKIIKRKQAEASLKSEAAQKDRPLSDDELFCHTMKEVREIEEFRRIPLYQKKAVNHQAKAPSDSEVLNALEDTVRGRRPINLPDTQEYVEWIDQDYRGDIIEHLHRGRYAVQDCLDLHGVILQDAEDEVRDFMKKAVMNGHRCIKIIHGRGLRSPDGPVLKQVLVKWLAGRYRKYVAAFVTARQCDGGLGALYILLK